MKLKIKFIEIKHLPDSKDEFKSWSYIVKHKKKVIHDGFMSGPFFETKQKANEAVMRVFGISELIFQEAL